jgi:hypothetical protein
MALSQTKGMKMLPVDISTRAVVLGSGDISFRSDKAAYLDTVTRWLACSATDGVGFNSKFR